MKFRNLSKENKMERQFNYSRSSDMNNYNDVSSMVAPRNIYPLVIQDFSGPKHLRCNLSICKLSEKNGKGLVC